ncbi:hypothetical protein PENTCL1PPCAC_1401, partial [Pristionchus entomophagus]
RMIDRWMIAALAATCFSVVSASDQKQLFNYLFKDYRKELRPVKDDSSGPTNVTVQLYFKQIQKIQENDQIITLYCWLEEYWMDEFLRWDPAEFGGISTLHVPADMIWKPDLLVYNNANMNVKDNELQTNSLIEYDGKVSLFRAMIIDITCYLNMNKFPFDQQICYIMLASWSYDGSQIMLQTAEEPTAAPNANKTNLATLTHYIPNMEWKLVDFKYRSNLKFYECCPNPYPDISYFFAIKRNPSYYLFTLIIPSAFITIVTVIGFFTPHSSTGENTEKVSLGVTALLSLAIILMMVSDKLPATSDSVPLLGQYYVGLIFIMFLATYCTTFTLGIQMNGNAGRPIPKRMRSFLLSIQVNRSLFLKYFFGTELTNTQESIKMRLKKYVIAGETERIEAVVRTGHSRFPANAHQGTRRSIARTRCTHEQRSSRGSEIRDQRFKKSPVSCPPQFREAEEVQRQDMSRKISEMPASDVAEKDKVLNSIVMDVYNAVQSIRQDLTAHEHLRRIRKEWQMLARMLEKIIMWIFIICTIVFACVMLYDTQDPPLITDEYMQEMVKQ